MKREVSDTVKAMLLKKRRGILTRYSKIRDNGFFRVTIKGNRKITTDCNKTKDFYLDQIEKAIKIIQWLSSE